MTRPYSLFIKSNGYYYVQFLLADGSRSQNKSTGTKNRREAEQIAMEWYVKCIQCATLHIGVLSLGNLGIYPYKSQFIAVKI